MTSPAEQERRPFETLPKSVAEDALGVDRLKFGGKVVSFILLPKPKDPNANMVDIVYPGPNEPNWVKPVVAVRGGSELDEPADAAADFIRGSDKFPDIQEGEL